MSIPNVDTFEHDIAEEIRTKEATLTDIASAGGDVGNIPSSSAQTSNALFLIGALFIVAVLGIGVALFFFHTSGNGNQTPAATTTILPDSKNILLAASPTIHDAIGEGIGRITKSEYGYTMEILSYGAVFSYMLKNENAYADELAFAVGSPRDTGTSSFPFAFADVTLNNQNMRIGTSGSSTVVYAFVNARTLLVSSTTESLLALRSSILNK